MRLNARSPRQAIHGVLLCALVALAMPCPAQVEAPPAPPVEPAEAAQEAQDLGPMTIELDLDRLLFDNRGNNLQDPVWQLQASSGKRILFLPFTVDNVHRDNKLSRFPISVRGGRFIGYVIPKPDLNNGPGNNNDLSRIIRAAPSDLEQLLFEKVNSDIDDDGAALEQDINDTPEQDADKPTPEDAPRLTREITLRADGTVQWEMDRSFHAAQLQSASERNLYAYKIDPEQLRAQQPERPERLVRGENEDARTYAQRKREQQLADREKQNAYRELRDSLRDLPETFREPAPSLFYVAIEVSADDTLALQGPAPLPWTVDAQKKQLFEQLASGANAFKDEQGEDLAGSIVTLIQGHPLDARAIALATMRSKLAGQVTSDDPGYAILTRLLQSKDNPTRRIALYSVATVNPPTLASAKLIGVAGEAALGEERKMLSFASLGKLFATQISDADSARILIDRVSQTIADPQGPAAPQVVEQVLAALSPAQQAHRSQANDDVAAVMIEAIDLTAIEKDEFAGVAKAIVAQAPDNAVAAGWLDRHLLASADRDLVNQTLALLYEAQIKALAPEDTPELETPDTPAVPEPSVDDGALLLNGTIPIARPNHALIVLFESDDDLQQAAAWAVLGRFHLALPEADRSATPDAPSEPAPVDPALALFDSIMTKAKAREKTPASVVAFIVNQKTPSLLEPANDQLVALLADSDLPQKTARTAVEAYAASPSRYSQAIQSLESKAKQKLMESMYQAFDQESPLMAGLIAGQGPTMSWLTAYLNEHAQLPTDQAWAQHAKSLGEGTLLQMASSSDVTLATAGAAALVVSAGGDKQQELAFAQNVALMEARQQDLVSTEWAEHRSKIFASAFKRAAGTYQLVVTFGQPAADILPEDEPDGQGADRPVKRIDLGLLELRVQGVELSLSVDSVRLSPAPNELGIRLENPASLRTFSKPELSEIAPEHLSQPIDLLPEAGGVWAGQISLPDGRSLRVSLEPAN